TADRASTSKGHRPASNHPVAKTKKEAQSSRLPPVVRTITRIVSVVPLPLRLLIGALVALALALAARSRIAATRTRRLEAQRAELLEDVGLMQAALLPRSPERLGQVGASTAYRPADGPAAGGDFYDLFALEDGRLAAIVGDVSGHGRQALPHTALTRFTLRAYLEAGFSPRQALQTAGAALERQLGDSFATVVLAIYDQRKRILTYACAGHPPPLLLASEPFTPVTACSAPPIGAGMQTGTRQTVICLPGAAQVCLHTDGITEARVGSELFGAQRLAVALADLGPDASASQLLDRVAQQSDARPDDMAACLLRIPGGRQAPRVLAEELQLDAEHLSSARTKQFLLACGVGEAQVEGVLSAAEGELALGGGVMLEVQPASGSQAAQVKVRPDNVASIDSIRLRREMAGAR
ncbi:MAG: PP2C family protein-serine/threonine phosphatase, partial [Solirubrobacteraceae bacterium]